LSAPPDLTATAAGDSARVRSGHSVEIDGVSRFFGAVPAVDNVSLNVPAGQFLSILGPSGCGKTTLLRIIAGLDFPDSGRILIDGNDVTGLPAHRRPTNLVFQRGALFPHMSVADNVAYPLKRRKRARRIIASEVADALAMVRLESLAQRFPSQLSGGQAQRVALARALVSRPAVLLLDEPLAALDLSLRKEMQLELRRLQESLGMTFIFVTHDQEEALTMSSRIVVMQEGQVVQVGTPREIYDNPSTVFASTFIGETNLLRGAVAACSAGVVTIDVNGLELRAADSRVLPDGTQVALSIRPERVRQGNAAGTDANELPGEVAEVVFLGNRVRARVECAGTSVWVQQDAAVPPAEQLSEGRQTTISWPVADGRLLLPDGP
jgi:spermidine/putrescine transport system ATP-binding protein